MSIETTGKENIIKHEKDFESFYNFLIETNKQFNLTAITTKNEVFEKHFLDSLAPLEILTKDSKVIDIGAGAGFPSIPLKIVRSDLKLTMIDSLTKRVNFLNDVINLLKLQNVEALHCRAEDLAINPNYRESFDVAVSRAVASLNTLLEYAAPFIKIDGLFVAFKGVNYNEEIKEAANAAKVLGMEILQTIDYNLSQSGLTRTLVVYKKINHTPMQYPRGQNKPKVSPL